MLSVVCPIRNEEKYIQGCIESILSQDYPKEEMEVVFADGMSSDKTRNIITSYVARHPWIKLIDNPKLIAPTALNLAIKAAKGDVILRLDAHTAYPPNYFSALVGALNRYGAGNVGASVQTDVLNKTPKSLAICEVLSHPLGVGNSTFRLGTSEMKEVDTVPFGCWRREIFDKYGFFDERLTRNQDIEFNKRLSSHGEKILLVPNTHVVYYARETFRKLWLNNFSNGVWNIKTIGYTRNFSSLSLRHFIPLLFVLSLILPLSGMFLWMPLGFVALASITAYLLTIGSVSLKIALKKHRHFIYLMSAFMVLHFSNGIGMFVGLFRVGPSNRKPTQSTD